MCALIHHPFLVDEKNFPAFAVLRKENPDLYLINTVIHFGNLINNSLLCSDLKCAPFPISRQGSSFRLVKLTLHSTIYSVLASITIMEWLLRDGRSVKTLWELPALGGNRGDAGARWRGRRSTVQILNQRDYYVFEIVTIMCWSGGKIAKYI